MSENEIALQAENLALKAKMQKLDDALAMYGDHTYLCDTQLDYKNECTCGFEQILAKGGVE